MIRGRGARATAGSFSGCSLSSPELQVLQSGQAPFRSGSGGAVRLQCRPTPIVGISSLHPPPGAVECPSLPVIRPAIFARLPCFVRREHDYRLRGRDGRVFLECARCGARSPGWLLEPRTRPLRDSSVPLRAPLLDESAVLPLMPQEGLPAVTSGSARIQPAEGALRLSFD